MKRISYLFVLITCICLSTNLFAQVKKKVVPPKTRILFLLDCSGSMLTSFDNSNRMNVAKKVMYSIIDSLENYPEVEIGLRLFGSQSSLSANDCKDSKLEVPVKTKNHALIKEKIEDINPKGITPIAWSLLQSADDFPYTTSDKRNILILITDGIESCGGDPCAVSLKMQKQGLILKPFIIGLGSTPEFEKAFSCMGKYYDATNEKAFKKILENVVNQVISSTTVQVNLLDINDKPTETNVGITLEDAVTGKVKYNFIHTLNARGVPDTMVIDQVNTYNLLVHTTPQVEKRKFDLEAGVHNIISVNAAQGFLTFTIPGADSRKIQAIVYDQSGKKLISTLEESSPLKLLVGKYKVEVLTLPKTTVDNVDISQSKTTTLTIPTSGLLTVLNTDAVPVFASIYEENGRELNWVADLTGNITTETFALQPGKYRLVYRNRAAKKSDSTKEFSFGIISGKSISFKL